MIHCMLPVAVARSFSGGIAVRYALPVLWIMSYFRITAAHSRRAFKVWLTSEQHRERSVISTISLIGTARRPAVGGVLYQMYQDIYQGSMHWSSYSAASCLTLSANKGLTAQSTYQICYIAGSGLRPKLQSRSRGFSLPFLDD